MHFIVVSFVFRANVLCRSRISFVFRISWVTQQKPRSVLLRDLRLAFSQKAIYGTKCYSAGKNKKTKTKQKTKQNRRRVLKLSLNSF